MGFITGLGQSTPAMRQNYSNAVGAKRRTGSKRKKKRAVKAAKPKRQKSKWKKSKATKKSKKTYAKQKKALKFGSPAWRKRYGGGQKSRG